MNTESNEPRESIDHPRLDELIGELHDARRDLLDTVNELRDAVVERQPAGGWSLAQILEHLAAVENGAGRLITKLIREARDRGVVESNHASLLNSLDHTGVAIPTKPFKAPDFTAPNEGLSVDDALKRLEESRSRLLASVATARGIDLTTVSAPHPALGPLDGYRWILATALHERRHTHQIRALAHPEKLA